MIVHMTTLEVTDSTRFAGCRLDGAQEDGDGCNQEQAQERESSRCNARRKRGAVAGAGTSWAVSVTARPF